MGATGAAKADREMDCVVRSSLSGVRCSLSVAGTSLSGAGDGGCGVWGEGSVGAARWFAHSDSGGSGMLRVRPAGAKWGLKSPSESSPKASRMTLPGR